MFLSKAFTFNTYTAFQTHDSLLCAAPVRESKQRGKHTFVWIYKRCLNVSTELIPLYSVASWRYQATTEILNPLWPAGPSPTHSLWSKRRRQVILWIDGHIRSICAEQLMSISRLNESHSQIDSTNLYTCSTQRNQFKSFFRLWALCILWELMLFV